MKSPAAPSSSPQRARSRRWTATVAATLFALSAGSITVASGAAAQSVPPASIASRDLCLPIPGLPCIPGLPELPELPLPELPLPELPGGEDTTPPDTSIVSGPAEGATIADDGPEFAFSGSPSDDVDSFECNLDGSAYITCVSTTTLQNLDEGRHTFTVRAIDAAGNADPSPASRTFIVKTATTASYSPECIAAATRYFVARDNAQRAVKQQKTVKARFAKAKKARKVTKNKATKRRVVRLKKQLKKKQINLKTAQAESGRTLSEAIRICDL